jgi:hypothetical protein
LCLTSNVDTFKLIRPRSVGMFSCVLKSITSSVLGENSFITQSTPIRFRPNPLQTLLKICCSVSRDRYMPTERGLTRVEPTRTEPNSAHNYNGVLLSDNKIQKTQYLTNFIASHCTIPETSREASKPRL